MDLGHVVGQASRPAGGEGPGHPVRIPEKLWEKAEVLARFEQRLAFLWGTEDGARDSTGAWAWSDEKLEEVQQALRPVVSLELSIGDGKSELGELISDPMAEDPADVVARDDARYRLAKALAALPERERTILSKRVGLDGPPLSLAAIGKGLGISRERVRQLEGAALKELRERREELSLEGLAA